MVTRTIPILVPYAEQRHRAELRSIAPRLDDLRGKTIGFIYNTFVSTGIIHDELRRLLAPYDIKAIAKHKKFWRSLDPEQFQDLVEHADAVISGLCNTPPSTSRGTHDSIEFERRGKPTVTLATLYYEDLLAETALSEGMPDLRRIIVPSLLEELPEDAVKAVAQAMLAPVIDALTRSAAPTIARV